MALKRTIILNNDNDKTQKAILSLECDKVGGLAELKLFNTSSIENLALGIKKENSDVVKIPLTILENKAKFNIPINIGIKEKVFCALVDVFDVSSPKVVLSGYDYGQDRVKDVVEIAFFQNKELDKDEMYEVEDEKIEDIVDKTLKEDEHIGNFDMCAKCKYRQCFYNETKTQSTSQPEKENVEIENKDDFYTQIKEQIDELFVKHLKDEELSRLIPNSKWVRVELDGGESYYVLGLIYEGEEIKYIAYGLPAINSSTPPEDLKEYAQWLPLDPLNKDEKGYWIVYQSAGSGESVLINVV